MNKEKVGIENYSALIGDEFGKKNFIEKINPGFNLISTSSKVFINWFGKIHLLTSSECINCKNKIENHVITWTITASRNVLCAIFCLQPLQPARPLFAYSALYGNSSDIFNFLLSSLLLHVEIQSNRFEINQNKI